MAESQWVSFTGPGTGKRKRAGVVCLLCHSKKVRCDLQIKRNQGYSSCSYCSSAGRACRPRLSKRDRGRSAAAIEVSHVTSPSVRGHDNHNTRCISPNLNGTSNDPSVDRPGRQNASAYDQNKLSALRIESGPLSQPTWTAFPSTQGSVTAGVPSEARLGNGHGLRPDLRQSFTETYFEYCYPWCPVLNRVTLSKELEESLLLDNAVALVGSHIRPPLIPQAGPAIYYDRARRLFYEEEEENPIIVLKAISLFYWWAPRPPSVIHKHSSWWWTSVVIRHAQQAGFYRESATELTQHDTEPYIRRRIWWTAFARERLTAICQGKPCLIDPADCNIPQPSLQDFPDVEDKEKAEVFIYWVRLCTIIGHIAKRLSMAGNSSRTANTFPADLGKDLIDWIQSLPPHLQLPINSSHTLNFNRDVHQLHLPYLAVIVVLHLTRSSQSHPQALPPATLAGSCIARILKDILIRSGMRFLMPITCWYVGMGFIALLQASRNETLKDSANTDLEILVLAMRELKNMWGTAEIFEQTFEQLRSNDRTLNPEDFPNRHLGNERSTRALNSEEEVLHSGIDWIEYFPFVTSQTSVVAEKLLAQQKQNWAFWDSLSDMAINKIPSYEDFMGGLDCWTDFNTFM
ncbi:fungal-specific transcription factor domain-containing protein [Aspergillus ambiguus]|uniref:fungal specific transcription factor domain-containing protein n=1 Tax=Aspergillus ambiguus TaxID=176160 RepID=UPI003CCC9445